MPTKSGNSKEARHNLTIKTGEKIIVLGLGNTMFSDEGFGVEVVREIGNKHDFPPNVEIIDGGTQGIYLLPYFESADRLLIFDALIPIEYELKIYEYFDDELPAFIHRKLSSHQIGLSELLSVAKLHGKLPERIVLIGVPPQELGMNVGLSSKIKQLLPLAAKNGIKVINKWLNE
ncbi:MAG: HyaD/HybD family hydrogenase maturation endopeptidase [Candidatus Marinimicrobia bacterium]|nr:HyaD/HybD family hydrogenase maturation endopeptidase [Candidatus Neomarinimicrobiota bacterium]